MPAKAVPNAAKLAGKKQWLKLDMSRAIGGYGHQPRPKIPSASQTYDLTPLLQATLQRVRLGCKR